MAHKKIYAWACDHPSKSALIHNGTTISYSAFSNAIGTTFDYLETHKLPRGQNVVVIIHDLLDCWVAVLALQALGLNTICIRTSEILEILQVENVSGVVTTERESPKHQLEPDGITGNRVIKIPKPTYTSEELPQAPATKENMVVGGHILYTSGTTGNYKKLYFPASMEEACATELIQENGYNVDTVFHCAQFGLWTGAGYKAPLAVWHAGACVIIDQRPDWHRHFMNSGTTKAFFIPEMVSQLINSLDEESSSPPPMDFQLIVAGGFISRDSAERIIKGVTRNLGITYGSTEVNVRTLHSKVTNLDDLHWLSCVDRRIVEILDEDGDICPVGQEGQLRIGLTDLDCNSYLDNPEATKEVFRSGYFYPGDMAVQRADGRIRILGRSADVVNFRGQKLSVAPIEEKIQSVLGVNAVCLFSGINSAGEEEVVIAMETERWPEKSDLNYLGHEFAQFDKVRFAIIHPFPRTQTGTSKISRVALRKLVFPVE